MGPVTNSGSTLSSANWNAMVANVQQLDSRTMKAGGEVITVWGR